ncbi:hypothetical protein PSEUDO8BK_190021 [Pseudomonas sp. 8BK]|uniref:hypothetical protein n=1 Tax=Pseudomonas sp. 8BK TaxID=2653164 RepID=UPI0012EEF7FD|nr:hypothetical protein [Pseudomonas sp. 8BK]VXB28612.1 hypothetical protein PSEUDO8BK_190021 [Pseudomonas sp. 8BK]
MAGDLARFDVSWFIPTTAKYRKLLGDVRLVSFVLNIFAFLTPLFPGGEGLRRSKPK